MTESPNFYGKLELELPIGYKVNDIYTREVVLAQSDAIAEEVFTKKSAEKPYSWIGKVLTIDIGTIGDAKVAEFARQEYLKSKSVTIPHVIKQMPLADANSMLLEIHRRLWKNEVKNQEIICKYCSTKVLADIDLSQAKFDEEDRAKLENKPEFSEIICDLPVEVSFDPHFIKVSSLKQYADMEIRYNRIVFRVPTLGDAIKSETYHNDNLVMWRRIALDCIVAIQKVVDGKVVEEFPIEALHGMGLDFYKYAGLGALNNLKAIRTAVQEELPTMHFSYTAECPCDRRMEIPMAMEASNFFST